MARYGVVEPPVVDERTGRLVAGHGRLEAFADAKAVGLDVPEGVRVNAKGEWLVPVIRGWSSRNDAEAEAYLVTSNELTITPGWDDNALAEMLADMDRELADIAGFDFDRLSDLLPEQDWPKEPDAVPDPPEEPISKLGDLWLLGGHRLLCGDSLQAESVRQVMNGERAFLMATDPPYLVDYRADNHPQSWHNRDTTRNKEWDDYVDPESAGAFFTTFLAVALAEALVDTPVIYQWHASRRQRSVEDAWRANGLLWHQTLIWAKARPILTRSHFMWQHEPCAYGWLEGRAVPKDRRPPPNEKSVWHIDQKGESDGIHPTQKPVATLTGPLRWHMKPGEVCFEPFSGSGTCIIAAEMTARRCFALELSPVFVDVACRRFQQFTDVLPVLESTGEAIDFTVGS
jgi:DNA modification methylase